LYLASAQGRSSALTAVGSCLGIYLILAIAYHWLVEPVAKGYAAAKLAIPETAVAQPAPPIARPELPFPAPAKRSRSTGVSDTAATPDPDIAVAPPKRSRSIAVSDTDPDIAVAPPKRSRSITVSSTAANSDASDTSPAVTPSKPARKQAAARTGRRERSGRNYHSPFDFISSAFRF
jgi:hypothetical protein